MHATAWSRQPAKLIALPLICAVLAFGALVTQPAQAFQISFAGTVGSGKEATETRNVSGFEAISTRGSIDVVVKQSDHESVQLKADDNLLPLIETTVENTSHGPTLVIGIKRGHNVSTRGNITATVDVTKLTAVSSNGSGDIRIESLKTPALSVSIAGSADARLQSLDTETLDISVSGSGDVSGAGRATKLKVSVAGSGNVALKDLQSDDVTVGVAGSGDADVTANKTLSVSVAGSGDVVYHGNGSLVKSSVAGSGSVTKR